MSSYLTTIFDHTAIYVLLDPCHKYNLHSSTIQFTSILFYVSRLMEVLVLFIMQFGTGLHTPVSTDPGLTRSERQLSVTTFSFALCTLLKVERLTDFGFWAVQGKTGKGTQINVRAIEQD